MNINAGEMIKTARKEVGLTQKQLAEKYEIPIRTLQDWEYELHKCPSYVLKLLLDRLALDYPSEQEPKAVQEQPAAPVPKPEPTLFNNCVVGVDCSNCVHRGIAPYLCIKDDKGNVLTGKAKVNFIKDFNSTVLIEADFKDPLLINGRYSTYCTADAKRQYKGKIYTVITDRVYEDVQEFYEKLITKALRPYLIKNYKVSIDANGIGDIKARKDCLARCSAINLSWEQDKDDKGDYAMADASICPLAELGEMLGLPDNATS